MHLHWVILRVLRWRSPLSPAKDSRSPSFFTPLHDAAADGMQYHLFHALASALLGLLTCCYDSVEGNIVGKPQCIFAREH